VCFGKRIVFVPHHVDSFRFEEQRKVFETFQRNVVVPSKAGWSKTLVANPKLDVSEVARWMFDQQRSLVLQASERADYSFAWRSIYKAQKGASKFGTKFYVARTKTLNLARPQRNDKHLNKQMLFNLPPTI
jgi:hypothetical protein